MQISILWNVAFLNLNVRAIIKSISRWRAYQVEHVKQIDARGAVVIPKNFRGNFTHVEVTQREDGVIELRPRIMVDPTQAWFWTQPWQTGEAKAQADIDAGRTKRFENGDDFLAELHSLQNSSRPESANHTL